MPVATAQRVLRQLGPSALETVTLCVQDCRRLKDEKAERFWNDVAAHLQGMTRGKPSAVHECVVDDDAHLARRRWLLMQKIELYRHRAMKAERLAGGGSEGHRDEMLDLAMQWFDLARQHERMAKTL